MPLGAATRGQSRSLTTGLSLRSMPYEARSVQFPCWQRGFEPRHPPSVASPSWSRLWTRLWKSSGLMFLWHQLRCARTTRPNSSCRYQGGGAARAAVPPALRPLPSRAYSLGTGPGRQRDAGPGTARQRRRTNRNTPATGLRCHRNPDTSRSLRRGRARTWGRSRIHPAFLTAAHWRS